MCICLPHVLFRPSIHRRIFGHQANRVHPYLSVYLNWIRRHTSAHLSIWIYHGRSYRCPAIHLRILDHFPIWRRHSRWFYFDANLHYTLNYWAIFDAPSHVSTHPWTVPYTGSHLTRFLRLPHSNDPSPTSLYTYTHLDSNKTRTPAPYSRPSPQNRTPHYQNGIDHTHVPYYLASIHHAYPHFSIDWFRNLASCRLSFSHDISNHHLCAGMYLRVMSDPLRI